MFDGGEIRKICPSNERHIKQRTQTGDRVARHWSKPVVGALAFFTSLSFWK